MPIDDETELHIQALVFKGLAQAIAPYERQIEDLKQGAARAARFAEEDRLRLAAALRDETENQAEIMADKIVRRLLSPLGLDPDKPADFVLLMGFLREFRKTMEDARRHGFFVIIGLALTGIGGLLWKAFQMSAKP